MALGENEFDPLAVNIALLPAGAMLGFVNGGYWRDFLRS